MMPKHLDGLLAKLCVTHGKISRPQYGVLVMVI